MIQLFKSLNLALRSLVSMPVLRHMILKLLDCYDDVSQAAGPLVNYRIRTRSQDVLIVYRYVLRDGKAFSLRFDIRTLGTRT